MPHTLDRRQFLGAAAATGMLIVAPTAIKAADANSTIELGLIGCGGRGNFIANLVGENGKGRIVAVCDYFQDRVDSIGEKLKIDPSRRYVGLDGYLKMLESKLDGVMVISPPYFHPEQAIAAMQHGKHVYLAKPVAVDVPGAMSLVEAAGPVSQKLSCWVDFQTRVDPYYQGAAQQLFAGAIGKPFLGQAYYFSDRLPAKCKPGSEMARLRNWVFDKALSGDIIVEQNIHAIDVANWFLRNHPTQASGTGGRKVRTDVGDCWDHFLVNFSYPDDVQVSFCSRQAGFGPGGIVVNLCCETGTVESQYAGLVHIRGKSHKYAGGSSPDLYRTGAATNIKLFLDAILAGKPINNIQESANSAISAMLGRTAAYEQTTLTWDEFLKRNQRIDPKLQLPADGPKWVPA